MGLLKYLERANRMDNLIRRRATGNSFEFAAKLGISRSLLQDHISDLKELGAPIKFCTQTQSYYYEYPFRLGIKQKAVLRQINGGLSIKVISEDFTSVYFLK